MPNGGVPIHMMLYPRQGSDVVIYCHAGEMRIFSRKDWEVKGVHANPIAIISESESAALAWVLKYWLGDERLKPGYRMSDITAEFDF